ncbi:MAG TPA: TetR/AcrR family transcriptional regulator [Pseudonocardiaceae bacterium]|nr:TetR/AcrR family transcriptional regulator [Pseudonocardiaceae bacterium]
MTDTRERIVTAGAELFRRNGFTGTGVKQIVAAASAPFGSLYHFFPGGKNQLAEEIIRWSGGMYLGLIDAIYGTGTDLVTATRNAYLLAAQDLRASDYADACPIATIALEVASTNEALRQATADVFESWITGLAARFAEEGIDEPVARDLAIAVIGALEGAFVLCRSLRDTGALEVASTTMADTVQAAIEGKWRGRAHQ